MISPYCVLVRYGEDGLDKYIQRTHFSKTLYEKLLCSLTSTSDFQFATIGNNKMADAQISLVKETSAPVN
jgi:hypothetical protein